MDAQQFTETSIAEMVAGVKKYLRAEREVYLRHSEPLAPDVRQTIEGFSLLTCWPASGPSPLPERGCTAAVLPES